MAAIQRVDAEQREEVGGNGRDLDALGLRALSRERADRPDQLPAGAGSHHFERLAALLVVLEVPGRHRGQRLRADAEVHPEARDPLRRPVWKRSQQHAVEDRKNRRGGADPEGEREDGQRSEARTSTEHAQRVPKILRKGRHGTLISERGVGCARRVTNGGSSGRRDIRYSTSPSAHVRLTTATRTAPDTRKTTVRKIACGIRPYR